MKKFLKGIVFYIVVVALIAGACFGGFKLYEWWADRNAEARITFSAETRTLTWRVNSSVVKYEVVVNDDVVRTIENIQGRELEYNLNMVITSDVDEYYFYIISYNQKGEATTSETFAYLTTTAQYTSALTANAVHDDDLAPSNAKLTKYGNIYVYSWDKAESSEDQTYILTITSSNIASRSYKTTDTVIDVSQYLSENDIYYISVGTLTSDTTHYAMGSYVNTENATVDSKYLDNVYYFDGELNDYYIKNQRELNNLLYYAFIYKVEEIEFYVPNSFINYDTITSRDRVAQCVKTAVDNIHETLYIWYSTSVKSNNEYMIELSYGTEVNTLRTEPTVTSAIVPDMYSERYVTKISDDYKFASDSKMLAQTVDTSEELYWVVESGATPICVKDSSAESIYNKAKDILKQIISDDMTDYEKALSVFDYISINTNYDNAVLEVLDESNNRDSVKYRCFYLEGAIEDKVAVCDGLSKSFSLLLNMIGVDTVRVSGTARADQNSEGGGHAWNKVKIDGEWYVVDLTWANILTSVTNADGSKAIETKEYPTHEYFCVSDLTIADTHTPFDASFDSSMPATKDLNYYENMTYTYTSQGVAKTISLVYGEDVNGSGASTLADYRSYAQSIGTSIVEIFVPTERDDSFRKLLENPINLGYSAGGINKEYCIGITSSSSGTNGYVYFITFSYIVG